MGSRLETMISEAAFGRSFDAVTLQVDAKLI